MQDLERIKKNLEFIEQNRGKINFPAGWIQQSESEAIEAGLLSGEKIGCNCKEDARFVVYGGDHEEVF